MALDPRVKEVKEGITSSELHPLTGMALTAFAKAVIAEGDGDAKAAKKWLGHALKQEAKQASA